MREYTVEQSSLDFKWTFQRMLPSLPGPGSPAFAELCKGLHPYGITPAAVTVDFPSARLGDLILSIGLLGNRVTVRVSSAALEVFVKQLLVGDEEKLVPIADLLFTAVKTIDPEAIQGQASLRASSHLKLQPGQLVLLLSEHIRYSDDRAAFTPEAVVFLVQPESPSTAKELKVAVARSLAYEDSVFVDISAEYAGPIDPSQLAEQMNTDSERIIEVLGLREQPDQ